MHSSTSSARHPVLDQRDGAEEVREEQPVDDEARDVGDLDRGLVEVLAERQQPRARLLGGLGGNATSTSSIRCTGLKKCRPRSDPGGRWRASSAAESDDVVEARIASSASGRRA